MAEKQQAEPKPTDEERHARFVEMAREVGASKDASDFDKAFKKITNARSVIAKDD